MSTSDDPFIRHARVVNEAKRLSQECDSLAYGIESLFPCHHRAYPLNQWARESSGSLLVIRDALLDPATQEGML